jgi:crossover junction endodeoxyribonuclease RuvC
MLTSKLEYDKIILGIDPGTNNMGVGVIGIKGKKPVVLAMDVLKMDNLANQPLKLKKIFETVLRNIDTFKPDELAVESPFFGKNVQSMLKLGRAQGVALAAALYRDIPVFEYSPRKIKQSITGKGSASKEQVSAMLQTILKIDVMPSGFDASDAVAVALCHYFQKGNGGSEQKNYSGWKSFLANNPGRESKKP